MKMLKIWAFVMAIISVLIIVTSCVLVNKTGKTTTKTETVTETESETEAETEEETKTPVVILTEEERTLMARVLYNEAGANSIKLMEYCASVMVNRLFHQWHGIHWYGTSMKEVLSKPGAFDGYKYLDTDKDNSNKPDADLTTVLSVIDRICYSGSILPEYIWIFRKDEPFTWEGLETYEILEGIYFQYFDEEHRATGWH